MDEGKQLSSDSDADESGPHSVSGAAERHLALNTGRQPLKGHGLGPTATHCGRPLAALPCSHSHSSVACPHESAFNNPKRAPVTKALWNDLRMEISQSAAALWAAGIGVAASAVASLITARGARNQAELGAQAQLEAVRLQAIEAHSQEKKRRQQRAYADFYTAANVLRAVCVDAEQELKGIPSDAGSSELDEANVAFEFYDEELHRKARDLWHGYCAIGLEGPDAVDDAAENLFEAFEALINGIRDWARRIMAQDVRFPAREEGMVARISELESDMVTATEKFLEEAQKVLE